MFSSESEVWDAIGQKPDYLATLSADERAVYLAAFGAFAASLSAAEMVGRENGAAARGRRAVRWFRELKEQGKL